jgi:hypothetical protein
MTSSAALPRGWTGCPTSLVPETSTRDERAFGDIQHTLLDSTRQLAFADPQNHDPVDADFGEDPIAPLNGMMRCWNTLVSERKGGRVRLPPLTLPASPTKAERTWAELHPMDRPEGPLGPSAHRTRGRSGRRHHSLQLPT